MGKNEGGISDLFGKFGDIEGHLEDFGEDPLGAVLGLGADGVGLATDYGPQLLKAAGFAKQAKFLGAAETPIIEAGLTALEAMTNLCGFGDPDEGEGFGQGADAYEDIGNKLSSTDAPGTWTGSGSQAYTGQNDAQEDRAVLMSQTDRGIADVLKTEAEQLDTTRKTIEYSSSGLTMAIVPAIAALAIEIPPGAGVALSMEIQTAAVAVALPIATAAFEMQAMQAGMNASQISALAKGYAEAGKDKGGGSSGAGGQVSVVTGDLRDLAGDQDEVAKAAASACQTTSSTGWNVFVSHGLVCSPTSAAVAMAISDRTDAGEAINAESTDLSDKLGRAASKYDEADSDLSGRLRREVPPR